MTPLKTHKVVAALPGVLEPDSIYFVRVGSGYDQFVTNSSGTVVAYPMNRGQAGIAAPALPPVILPGMWLSPSPNAAVTSNFSTAAGTIRLGLWCPVQTVTVDQLAILTVGTALGGTNAAWLLIYSASAAGWPDVLLASVEVTGLGAAGLRAAVLAASLTLQASGRYWTGLHSNFANTHRHISAFSYPHLGYPADGTGTPYVSVTRTVAYSAGPPAVFGFTAADLSTNSTVSEIRMRVV